MERSADVRDGHPDEHSPLVDAMAAAIIDAEVYRETARAQPVRASEAGGCARAIGYGILARRGDMPMPQRAPEDLVSMMVGTELHEGLFANAMNSLGLRAAVGRRADIAVSLEDGWELPEYRVSGHQDAETRFGTIKIPPRGDHTVYLVPNEMMVTRMPRVIAVEFKSIGGTGFKTAACGDNPQGPRTSALLQGALAALAKGADELVILYLAREAVSKLQERRYKVSGLRRVLAQWTYTREQYEPLAHAEGQRLAGIAELVDAGDLPLRELQDGRDVVDPRSGATDDGSYTWECAYCPYQPECVKAWEDNT